MPASPEIVSVSRIFLDLKNPRHKPYTSEEQVIDYLCRSENVYALAKDMTEVGLNPLELFALMPLEKKRRSSYASYVVAEGNRRLCAIKLLNDPDRAPANLRRDFKRLSETPWDFSKILAIIFDNQAQVDAWLERIHGGVQGGIGRKPWSPEQKTRHIGDRKNILAQAVLDYAEKQGFISAEDRRGRITTAQRYLGNALIREAIGIESSSSSDVSLNRPIEDFNLLVKRFIRDLLDDTVHSRANAATIVEYSRNLADINGLSRRRVAATSLASSLAPRRSRRKPQEPPKPQSIGFEQEIDKGLKRIGSYKLQRLYFSICDLPLEQHTPLISIGVWSFLETLTARCGRDSTTAFPSFFSKAKLASLGFEDRDQVRSILQIVERISSYGNTTKHHDTSANFNGEQLANDMDALKDVLIRLISELPA